MFWLMRAWWTVVVKERAGWGGEEVSRAELRDCKSAQEGWRAAVGTSRMQPSHQTLFLRVPNTTDAPPPSAIYSSSSRSFRCLPLYVFFRPHTLPSSVSLCLLGHPQARLHRSISKCHSASHRHHQLVLFKNPVIPTVPAQRFYSAPSATASSQDYTLVPMPATVLPR